MLHFPIVNRLVISIHINCMSQECDTRRNGEYINLNFYKQYLDNGDKTKDKLDCH